jgi:hypothetical protein
MSFFSAQKVNALIPILTPLIQEMWGLRRQLAIALLEQDPALRNAGGRPGRPAAEYRAETRRCTELKAGIVHLIGRIEAHGCVVKDIDLGLLDFPALHAGRPVFLCWKAGEAGVSHWHGTAETFGQRKAL